MPPVPTSSQHDTPHTVFSLELNLSQTINLDHRIIFSIIWHPILSPPHHYLRLLSECVTMSSSLVREPRIRPKRSSLVMDMIDFLQEPEQPGPDFRDVWMLSLRFSRL